MMDVAYIIGPALLNGFSIAVLQSHSDERPHKSIEATP